MIKKMIEIYSGSDGCILLLGVQEAEIFCSILKKYFQIEKREEIKMEISDKALMTNEIETNEKGKKIPDRMSIYQGKAKTFKYYL